MQRHGIVAAEKLKGKLPKEALHAIKAHDHRTGFKPKSRIDKALVAADSMVALIEKLGKQKRKLNIKVLWTELAKTSKNQPWLQNNIAKCSEIGLTLHQFFKLCLNAIKQHLTKTNNPLHCRPSNSEISSNNVNLMPSHHPAKTINKNRNKNVHS
jgi:predicted hydrolase (HD superfamily)